MTTITCIIPVFNEEERIVSVLKELVNSNKINEIICVNDGSSDNSAKIIKKNFPKIKLINHKKNLGKARAVKTGLKHSVSDIIMLIDADIKYVSASKIDTAIKIFEKEYFAS